MSNVINRTTYEYLENVNTPDFPVVDWLVNPDVSALEGSVLRKYWKVDGDTVVEMSAGEKDVVDAALAAALKTTTEARLKDEILPKNYLEHMSVSCVASGLEITTTIGELLIEDVTEVTPDVSDTKHVLITLVYNSATDTFSVNAYEKTTGNYATLGADEVAVQMDIGEFSVVANGDTLVEV